VSNVILDDRNIDVATFQSPEVSKSSLSLDNLNWYIDKLGQIFRKFIICASRLPGTKAHRIYRLRTSRCGN